mmetsp:Transcript_47597/g.149160  ORF Transcript_47597/g.149160 Transcript_47597/m.149160 type:complete len:908 (+) Transcript_47597:278-3001(+)
MFTTVTQSGFRRVKMKSTAARPNESINISAPLEDSQTAQIDKEYMKLKAKKGLSTKTTEKIPINKKDGLLVTLEKYDAKEFLIDVSDMKVLNAGNKRSFVPHYLAISLAVDQGNPDCFITPDIRIPELGYPTKDKCVWHVKTNLKVLPTDNNYTLGKYHVQMMSGVDKCEFRVMVFLDRFIPTITMSQKGAGGGYRPGLKEKMENIWKSVIVGNISSSNQRRKQGWAGNFPMTDLNITSTILKNADKSDNVKQSSQRVKQDGDRFRRPESSERKPQAPHDSRWGEIVSVTFNRAVSSVCSSHQEAGSIRLKTRPFKDILYPKSNASPEPQNLSSLNNTFTSGVRQVPFSPMSVEPALEDATFWRGDPSRSLHSPLRARSTPIASPIFSVRESSGARDEVLALLKGSEPVAKKILPGYKYVELDVPTASVRGYAIKIRDGYGHRKIVQSDKLEEGEACFVAIGDVVPEGTDAVAELHFTEKVFQGQQMYIKVGDLLTSGKNIQLERRPLYAGSGKFITARQYFTMRYPHLLPEFEKIYKKHFEKFVPAVDHNSPGWREIEIKKMSESLVQPLIESIDTCSSYLFKHLYSHERRRLAEASQVLVLQPSSVLAHQGEDEEQDGRRARSLYILLAGTLVVHRLTESQQREPKKNSLEALLSKGKAPMTPKSHPSEPSSEEEAEEAEEAFTVRKLNKELGLIALEQYGTILGHIQEPKSVVGERQLFFGEPWPCTLRCQGTVKVAEISFKAYSDILLERPEILSGKSQEEQESKFTERQNHEDLMRIIDGRESLPMKTKAADLYALSREEGDEREALKKYMRYDEEAVKQRAEKKREVEIIDELIKLQALSEEQMSVVAKEREGFLAALDLRTEAIPLSQSVRFLPLRSSTSFPRAVRRNAVHPRQPRSHVN